jgi:hypothetical protein
MFTLLMGEGEKVGLIGLWVSRHKPCIVRSHMAGGLAYHQLWINRDDSGVRMGYIIPDESQQRAGRGLSHGTQWLMNGRKWRVVCRSCQHVIEAEH